MNNNESVIQSFYQAFQSRDYKSMQNVYADNAVFSDPVFPSLNAAEVKSMWEMFCVNGKDLKIEFSKVSATENTGSAEWLATYTFSATGKKVKNRITAHFQFENGKIVKHTDTFDFYNWSKQALGFTGLLLGWTSFVKNKVRKTARKSLMYYTQKKHGDRKSK
ncbi:MAG: nuclear transport factor 2 family protein [Bacteroidetes bacterium]|nr:nuclear transport factor 2 family protein [Bacteroidota bacterium]